MAEERHLQCVLATDSSACKWGAFHLQPSATEFGDFRNTKDSHPIHVKKAKAIDNALSALKDTISDHRLDVFVIWPSSKLGQTRERGILA